MTALEFIQDHPLPLWEIWTLEEAKKLVELLEADYPEECKLLMNIPATKAIIAAIHCLAFSRVID